MRERHGQSRLSLDRPEGVGLGDGAGRLQRRRGDTIDQAVGEDAVLIEPGEKADGRPERPAISVQSPRRTTPLSGTARWGKIVSGTPDFSQRAARSLVSLAGKETGTPSPMVSPSGMLVAASPVLEMISRRLLDDDALDLGPVALALDRPRTRHVVYSVRSTGWPFSSPRTTIGAAGRRRRRDGRRGRRRRWSGPRSPARPPGRRAWRRR